MKPPVSLGAKSPISSMEDSFMSYSFSVSELRPRTANIPLYARQRTRPLTWTCEAMMELWRNSRSGEKLKQVSRVEYLQYYILR